MSYHYQPYSRPTTPASSAPIPLSSSPAATAPSSTNAKADQIAHRFFNKLVLVVADARATSPNTNFFPNPQDPDALAGNVSPSSRAHTGGALPGERRERTQSKAAKIDKWFNLETPEFEQYKAPLAAYKSISTTYSTTPTPPLHISVLLSIPGLSSHVNSGTHHGPNHAQVLVHHFTPPEGGNPIRVTRVTPPPRYILLETHTLTLANADTDSVGTVELPQVYKQAISLFRSLYTSLRILPSWKLHRKLRRRGAPGVGNLALEVHVSVGKPLPVDDDRVAGFDAPLSQPPESLTTESVSFPPISTPLGSFSVRTMYRLHPHYALESLESLLSTHFLSPSAGITEPPIGRRDDGAAALREPVQFTPTLASARQRERKQSSGSPRSPLPALPLIERSRPFPIRSDMEHSSARTGSGASPLNSLPIRTSLPHSPSSHASGSAPIRNLHSSNSSISSSPRPRRVSALQPSSTSGSSGLDFPHLPTPPLVSHPLPSSLSGNAAGVPAGGSSPRFGFAHGRDVADLPFAVGLGSGRTSGTMERTRKESLLSNSGDRASTTGTSLHGRRPSINSIHPFKSATVASSPSSQSFRHNSPLSGQPPTLAVVGINPLANHSVTSIAEKRTSSASIDGGNGNGNVATGPNIHTTSALCNDTSSISEITPTMPAGTRRYSSSFGPRHAPGSVGSGGIVIGSDNSGGSGDHSGIGGVSNEPPPFATQRPLRDNFLAIQTDDDDISAFVKAIDSRAPLRGGHDTGLSEGEEDDEHDYLSPLGLETSSRRNSNPSSTTSSQQQRRDSRVGGPPMPTSRAEVDEALRRMTESFRVGVGSLEGGMRVRRQRSESGAPSAGNLNPISGNNGGMATGSRGRGSPVVEEDLGSSDNGYPGHRLGVRGAPPNLSSSSLAGGRRSYDSDQQIIGRLDLADEERIDPTKNNDTTIPRGTATQFARKPGHWKGF